MFPIAGQTTGPIGLKFFVDTYGFKKKIQIFFPLATPGCSASIK